VKASLISPDLANSVDILRRFERMQSLSAAGWETDYSIERCNAIRPNVTAGRERYARIAASTGIESRDPFLDKRVVDFCSMLPGHLRLRDGWPKVILREVMTDTLPAEILWTRRKRHLGWLFNAAVTRQAMYLEMLDIDEIQNSLDGYVDRAALTTAWKTFREGGEADQIHTAHVLSAWLENSANRPVVSGQPFV
jgi:asparagine synthetase B (glutamine-hydrolysing)